MRSLIILLLLSSPLSAESWLDTLLGRSESGCSASLSSEYPIQKYPDPPPQYLPSKPNTCYSCPKGMTNNKSNLKLVSSAEIVPLCCDKAQYPKECVETPLTLDSCRSNEKLDNHTKLCVSTQM
jgi:hypothetical protein